MCEKNLVWPCLACWIDDEVDSGAENEPPASKEDLNEKEEDAKKDD